MSSWRWFPWHCSQPPFCLPYKEPPYIHQGWGWNRLLLHNLECGPPCYSCHRFMRPVGSLEKEWYSSLKMSTLPVDVRFLFLPYPISTLVIFYFLENQMSVLDKSWRISVWCQKKYWDTGFSPWEQDGWGKRPQGSAPGFNLRTMTMRERERVLCKW